MAGGVRFTKPEREYLIELLNECRGETSKKLRASILDKLEKSELVKKRPTQAGIGWRPAYDAMKGVLGNRLVLPPSLTGEWIGRMSYRIRVLGLTEEHCRTIAKNISGWRGVISFERVIMGADRYLHHEPAQVIETGTPLPMEEL